MQRGSARLVHASALLGLALVLLTAWSSLPLGGAPTGAASGAATLALAVLAAVALGVALPRRGAGLAPALASRRALRRDRIAPHTPSRQCDPDAAGHPRPRAPGRG